MRLIILFCFINVFLFAQKSDLTSAILAFQKENTSSAKEFIDIAHEKYMKGIASGNQVKPKVLSKFWHYRGQIYLVLNDLDIAVEAFLKDIKLDAKGGFSKKSVAALNRCAGKYVSQAEESYKKATELFDTDKNLAKDYLFSSANSFLQTYEIRKTPSIGIIDTASLFNACLLFSDINNPDSDNLALDQAQKLVKLNPKDEKFQIRLLFCLEKKGDNDMYISAIKSARSNLPSSQEIINIEVNYYISIGDKEGLKISLDNAIKSDSSNPVLHFALGTALQSLGDISMAKISYLKAVELDSDYFDAHNNLASLYLDETSSLIKKMNKLGSSSSDQKRYDNLKRKRNELYNQSIPHLEECVRLDSSNISVLNVLKEIYYKVGDLKNMKRIKSIIDSM